MTDEEADDVEEEDPVDTGNWSVPDDWEFTPEEPDMEDDEDGPEVEDDCALAEDAGAMHVTTVPSATSNC